MRRERRTGVRNFRSPMLLLWRCRGRRDEPQLEGAAVVADSLTSIRFFTLFFLNGRGDSLSFPVRGREGGEERRKTGNEISSSSLFQGRREEGEIHLKMNIFEMF